MAVIVQAVFDNVEDLLDASRRPAVDALRPESCPLCGKLAHVPGEPLGIVGHGTYLRQVLGLVGVTSAALAVVQRYLCRGCARTISVLADQLHPGRWYAGGVILAALRLHLVEGRSEAEIRDLFGVSIDSETWRTLRRWRRQLLVTLWYWLAARLGVKGPAETREEGQRRVAQLLAEAASARSNDDWASARALATGTVHFQNVSWPLGRDPPENLARKLLCD